MGKQNIYDNETFFEGYRSLRNKENNANNLFEMPVMVSLLPDLKDKTVLDLGCGFGEHCIHYAREGAKKVIGIDISEKMLEIAETENGHPNITYIHMPMEDIAVLDGTFDLVVSSLAIHYVEDFTSLVKSVYSLLDKSGIFVFSQEHPLTTSYCGGDRWTRDEKGKKRYLNLANYGIEGERESAWFVDNVKKYHRTFGTVINTLTDSGFIIEKVVEPLPTKEILDKYPEYIDLFHKPDFMLVRARK